VIATAALSSIVAVGVFTVPELARGEALLADRSTTFFGGARRPDLLPPSIVVPHNLVVVSDPRRGRRLPRYGP